MEHKMKRFYLNRIEDATGVSGTGVIAEGIVFTDGTVALRWRTAHKSTGFYDSIMDLVDIHGHDGRTVVRWIDGGYFAVQTQEALGTRSKDQ